MLGHLGFSYVGLIFLMMLIIPNIIWAKFYIPTDYDNSNENKIFLIFERVGQVLVSCIVVIFSDFNINTISIWSLWLLFAFICMLIYEVCWLRYFLSKEHTEKIFYHSFIGIPIPLAVLPVLAFLILGIYGKVLYLIIASIILGVGHIGIHIQHFKAIK
jgi:hypothetical protein